MRLGMEIGDDIGPGDVELVGNSAPQKTNKGHSPPPNFRPMSIVAKVLDGLRCNLVWR